MLFVALSIANASNYIFHVVVSRILGPKAYGALGSVLALLFIISVPSSAIQATVARRVAALRSTVSPGGLAEVWGSYFRSLLPIGLVVSGTIILLSPLLAAFLHLGSWETGVFMGLFVLPAVVSPVTLGALQGTLRFRELALTQIVSVAVRLSAGIAIVKAGGGVPGAVAASLLAQWVSVGLGFWLLGERHPLRVRAIRRTRAIFREVAPVIGGLGAMWLLIELDLVLARHYLSPAAAGEFAAAGLLARAALFLTGAINLIALPHFSENRARGEPAYRMLRVSSAIILAAGVVASLGLTFGGHLAVSLTFGDRFHGAAHLLPILSFAMIGFGLANLVVYFQVAARSRLFHVLWVVALVETILIWRFHRSGMQIAVVVFGCAWSAAALGLLASRAMALAKTPLSMLPVDILVNPIRDPVVEAEPELSLVVPAYPVGPELRTLVEAATRTLDRLQRSYEVIVVADGTPVPSESLPEVDGPMSVVQYGRHHGKGVALRVGMVRARGRYVAFLDGDGDLDPKELKGFLTVMDLYDPDLVIGSKRHPLSNVQYPRSRRIMSWGYQRLVQVMFGLNVRDTQTGMKLVRRDVLDAVLPLMLEKRFAFDLEFLVVARRLGYRRIFEAPITLNYKFDSTIALSSVARILVDTAAIYYRRFILRSYDPVDDTRAEQDVEAPLLFSDPIIPEQQASQAEAAT